MIAWSDDAGQGGRAGGREGGREGRTIEGTDGSFSFHGSPGSGARGDGEELFIKRIPGGGTEGGREGGKSDLGFGKSHCARPGAKKCVENKGGKGWREERKGGRKEGRKGRREGRREGLPLEQLPEARQRPIGELIELGIALIDLKLLVVEPIQGHALREGGREGVTCESGEF
jgi:hypothetical protein